MLNTASDNCPVTLLIGGCTLTETQRITSALRNAGQIAHVHAALNLVDLEEQLESGAFDLVLINCDNSLIDCRLAASMARDLSQHAGIILLTHKPGDLLEFALQQGVRDVLDAGDTARLVFVVKREHLAVRDQAELRKLHQALIEAEERFTQVIGASKDAIAYVHEGMHIRANAIYLQMFGFTDESELDGLPVMDLVAETSRPTVKKILRALGDKETQTHELACQDAQGRKFAALMEFSPGALDGEPCTQITIRDQSKQRQLQERIDALATHDQDTGLPNRSSFSAALERTLAIAAGDGANIGLAQVCIANYAEIVEQQGLQHGIDILGATANLLRQHIDPRASLARLTDQTLIVMCNDSTRLTHALEAALSELGLYAHGHTDRGIAPIYAIGLVQSPADPSITASDWIDRSGQATRVARLQGDNQMATYSEEIVPSAPPTLLVANSLLTDVADALAHDNLELLYQPIVSLQGDTRENYAVTARLRDSRGAWQESDKIGLGVDNNELAVKLDRWIILHALEQLVAVRRNGDKLNFCFKLSAASVLDDNILLWICDQLREFQAKGAWLVFQFRAQDICAAIAPAQQLIEGLKKINCNISVSNFTDDKNNLVLLDRIPIDFVRLSGDYLTNLNRNEQQKALRTLVQSIHTRKIKTIIGHVEDANSVAQLWNVGVNYIQGGFLQEASPKLHPGDEQ